MAINTTSTTTFDAMLKEMYSDEQVADLVYKDHPFFDQVPKKTDWRGDVHVVPAKYGTTNQRSANFGIASATDASTPTIASGGSSLTTKFVVTTVKDYGVANLDRETILASENGGSFKDHLMFERQDVLDALGRSIGQALYRDGGGWVGRIGSLDATNTILTLKTAGEAYNFEVNQYIGLSADAGTGSLRGTPSYVKITAVDVSNNTITVASDITSAISGAVADDYIFLAGDHAAKISGLEAWNPLSTSGLGSAFFGVTRSVHTDRLAGVRTDATSSSESYEDLMADMAVRLYKNSGKAPTHSFVPDVVWRGLIKSLDSQVRFSRVSERSNVKSTVGSWSFESLKLASPRGMVDVIMDPDCPSDRIRMVHMPSLKLVSRKQAPHAFTDDGLLQRNSGSDSYNIRVGMYGNLCCYNTATLGVIGI